MIGTYLLLSALRVNYKMMPSLADSGSCLEKILVPSIYQRDQALMMRETKHARDPLAPSLIGQIGELRKITNAKPRPQGVMAKPRLGHIGSFIFFGGQHT